MENSYEVRISNRYSLFLDEDDVQDPLEILKASEKEKEIKKRAKLADIGNKVSSKPEVKLQNQPQKTIKEPNVKVAENKEVEDDGKKKKKTSVAKQAPVTNKGSTVSAPKTREEPNVTPNHDDATNSTDDLDRERNGFKPGFRDFRGRNRGNFRGRGTREFRGQGRGVTGNRFKREFDRQSGSDRTNVKPTDKRSGDGPYNWGSDRDEIAQEILNVTNDAAENPDESSAEEGVPGEKEVATVDKGNGEVNLENVDGKDETAAPQIVMTLDEYKALKQANRPKPMYNLRKPGEGEDPKQWKKMYALTKKKEAEDADEEYEELPNFPQRVGRQKYLLDIDVHFADTGNFRRGGRGRGRGRRAPDERPSAPKVDDEHDFPSLAGSKSS